MKLTDPVEIYDLRDAYPRDTHGMEDSELLVLLRIEERALRSTYGVVSTGAETDAALADAMLAAWPSFRAQVRQVAQESANAEGASVTYAKKGDEFTFPGFIGRMLESYADPDRSAAAPSVTQLVR